MTVRVRAQSDDDRHAVRAVLDVAFAGDGTVADLAEALRARSDVQAGLVAVSDSLVVGHAQLSISWVDAPSRLVEVLTLSPLGVSPAHQRRGVGGMLLAEAARTAHTLGSPLVFLEGDPAYYSRHGWRAAASLGFGAPSTRIPPAAFQVRALPTYEPGVMRGQVVYNDTFWSHDRVGLRP